MRVALLGLLLFSVLGGIALAAEANVKAARFDELTKSALAKQNAGDLAGAIADYDRAAAIEPKIDLLYAMRADAKEKLKDWRGAIADYGRAIELKANASHYYSRAMAKIESSDLDGALGDFDQAIRIDPKHGPSYRGRAAIYERKEDWDRAIAETGRALEADPRYKSSSAIYVVRARLLARKGSWAAAIADYTHALELDPKSVAAYRGRAEAKRKSQDEDGAKIDEAKADEFQTAAKK